MKHRMTDGRDEILCTLTAGACPIQVKERELNGDERIICSQPHCVLVDWQEVEVEKLPHDEVRQYMTANR